MTRIGLFLVSLSSIGLPLWSFSPATAQDSIERFYTGKQVTITVGTPAGSSASLYAQVVARHIGRHLPGSPGFTVQHLPGAGGLVAANRAYSTMPRDGTALVSTNSVIFTEPLLGGKGAQFEAPKFTWIGGTHVEHTTCVSWHTSSVKTVQDAFTRELMVGSYGAEGPSAVFAKAANALAGTKFKLVTGYPGGPEALIAMERGEVEGFCAMGWNELKQRHTPWLTEKKVNILFQMGLEKDEELPHVPLISDYAKSPIDRSVFELLFTPLEMGRPLYAPPDVPADRTAALREALRQTLRDPAFLSDAAKMRLEVRYVSGGALQGLIDRIYKTPKDVIDRGMSISN
jgi:tripartite-type tricarboxylate transporter receptor subunit TctC